MVAAKNKYLVIDEIETALHYTAQEQLWEIIFEYAEKWNIQVFVTTHSHDSIQTFQYAIEKHKISAQYIRLQKSREDRNEALLYSDEKLQKRLNLDLEIR